MTKTVTKHEQAEVGHTRAEFEERFALFMDALTAYINECDKEFLEKFNKIYRVVGYERGIKFIRIVVTHPEGGQRSVYCFLDYQGNIYKAASWRSPAKHIRGSIFEDHFSIGRALGSYGAAYLR